jgi:hypothetical protein
MLAFLSAGDRSASVESPTSRDMDRAITYDIANILLAGALQRLEEDGRARLALVDMVLLPHLGQWLDEQLTYLIVTHLSELDQTYYLADGYNDLRSALVEAVMVGWTIDRGLVARHAVTACETFARVEAHHRTARRRRWLRPILSDV